VLEGIAWVKTDTLLNGHNRRDYKALMHGRPTKMEIEWELMEEKWAEQVYVK
jgi:hypothetical protein